MYLSKLFIPLLKETRVLLLPLGEGQRTIRPAGLTGGVADRVELAAAPTSSKCAHSAAPRTSPGWRNFLLGRMLAGEFKVFPLYAQPWAAPGFLG